LLPALDIDGVASILANNKCESLLVFTDHFLSRNVRELREACSAGNIAGVNEFEALARDGGPAAVWTRIDLRRLRRDRTEW